VSTWISGDETALSLTTSSRSSANGQNEKVSKAAGKKKPSPQRGLNISQKVSSGGLPLSSGVDAAEPQPSPDRVTPRRQTDKPACP
jgi:hypothetical protein